MQVPKRKPGKYAFIKDDLNFTQEKFNHLKNKLNNFKKNLPKAAAEVRRCAEMGDLSENAAYSIAKGRLRGIINNIDKLEKQINKAKIIKTNINSDIIELGSKVSLEYNNQQITYQILGSAEANPTKHIISHNSPIGSALIGKKIGDIIIIETKKSKTKYKITSIN